MTYLDSIKNENKKDFIYSLPSMVLKSLTWQMHRFYARQTIEKKKSRLTVKG